MKSSVTWAVVLGFCACLLACSSDASKEGGSTKKDTSIGFVGDNKTADITGSDPDLAVEDPDAAVVDPDVQDDDTAEPTGDTVQPLDGGGDDDTGGGEPDVPDQPAPCVDKDADGYGDNCYMGKDCDDANPNFNIYCPPCDQQSVEGCKCLQEGAAEVCYEGDPGSVGIGVCQLGQRFCQGSFWTACQGQILPEPESCDDFDNDCDGTVDEGVLSPCGDCDPFCDTIGIGPDGLEPFEPTEDNSEKVGLNMDGFLTLDSTKLDLAFIWVANSGQNTDSR